MIVLVILASIWIVFYAVMMTKIYKAVKRIADEIRELRNSEKDNDFND